MNQTDDDRDFGAILAEFEQQQEETGGTATDPEPGDRVAGTVLSIGDHQTFVDVGGKSDAVVATAELLDDDGDLTVGVGEEVEGMISGRDEESGCLMLRVRPGAGGGLGAGGSEVALEEISQAHEHGIPVEGTVDEVIKGGVKVNVSGLRAFCPVSQLDLAYVEDPQTFVGRRLTFLVRSFQASGRGGRPDVVLSRRDLLEREERKRREEAMARITEGAVVRGTVSSVVSYGAFVDLGGVEGLLHVSEIAHGRVEDPADVLQEGDVLDVKVLSIEEKEGERGGKRIALSRRALLDDPWEEIGERFPVGETVPGRVTRIASFGAFVEIAPGVEGLVHVSEMAADKRVNHPRDEVEPGDGVRVRVLDVDPARQRVSLSMAGASPGDGEAESAGEAATTREQGGGLGSGLGSMADFFQRSRGEDDPDRE